MPMTKKTFIQIADTLRTTRPSGTLFSGIQLEQWERQVQATADTLQAANPAFKRQRWIDYVNGKCNANGGAIAR